jgi:nitrate reductase molybdenum cofactor assembly chaperone NarJ/NarW
MKLLSRERSTVRMLQDRLVWQSASVLLAYPDERLVERLDTVDELRAHLDGPATALLGQTVAALRSRDLMTAATEYVETFDMRTRCTMYLTCWTAGDTRNRGRECSRLPPPTGMQVSSRRATRRPTTCLSHSSSPRPSIPKPGAGC